MPFITGELKETDIMSNSKTVEWTHFYFFLRQLIPTGHPEFSPSFTFASTHLQFVVCENSCIKLLILKETTFSIQYSISIKNSIGNLIGTKTFASTPGRTEGDDSEFSVIEALKQNEKGVKMTNSLTIVCKLQIAPEATNRISLLNEESTIRSLDSLRLTDARCFFKGLKEIFLNNMYSDFVLNVKGKEFKSHKIILAAHSPVFAAMFQHDMIEKNSNSVNIEDCEPEMFSDFLNFLYSGEIDNLNSDKALGLYEMADKYGVTELSELCLKYIMSNISIENILDILTLGLRHHVKELIDKATQFFLQNSKEIALTAKWITFLAKNPVAGNELFLKALDLKK